MREPPKLVQARLIACLQESYALTPKSIEYLPLGHDFNAGVYRVTNQDGTPYLVKVNARPLYEPACRIPYYLYNQGITSVIAPIPTLQNELWTRLDQWTVIVYPFVQGDTSLTGMTSAQWAQVGAIFHQIHITPLLGDTVESLKRETFDPTEYIRWTENFETQHLIQPHPGLAERALCASWLSHSSRIHVGLATLKDLGADLCARSLPFVICHADLHAANVLRDPNGNVFVIDWDQVMLAPKERDFIFLTQPQAGAFWDGYGSRDINSSALTYYLWERVIQDIIEYAEHVCLNDDLSQETKMDLVHRFERAFRADGLLANLPS